MKPESARTASSEQVGTEPDDRPAAEQAPATGIRAYFARMIDRPSSIGESMPELDGLRGLAVLIVMASHTDLLWMGGQGAFGVWLFFVLSSFLLTRIMRARLPDSLRPMELVRYMLRRVARILPLLYLCLVLFALIRHEGVHWVVQHMVFLRADWHLWSIPQEELFYILLPLLVGATVLAGKVVRGGDRVVVVLFVTAAIWSFPIGNVVGNRGSVPFYLNVFSLGFLLAHVVEREEVRGFLRDRTARWAVNALSVVALVLGLLTSPQQLAFYGRWFDPSMLRLGWSKPTLSGVVCLTLLVASLKRGSWLNRWMSTMPMRVLGALSFGLYLIHMDLLTLLLKRLSVPVGWRLFVPLLAVSVVIALILERLVERPAIRLGRRLGAELRRPGDRPAPV